MRRLLVGSLVGSFLCLMAASSIAQQGTAEIAGKVMDEQGDTNWDADWHEYIRHDLDRLQRFLDRANQKEVISTQGSSH